MKISNTKKNYWLIKSEPESLSLDQQKKKKTEHWDGVRNYQAANYMKQMKIGDECLFYHSVSENCLLYTSPSPRDGLLSRMPSSA